MYQLAHVTISEGVPQPDTQRNPSGTEKGRPKTSNRQFETYIFIQE